MPEQTVTADRRALQAAVTTVARVVPDRLDAVPALPGAQTMLATAAHCLQAGAGFLSSVTADPEHEPTPSVGILLGGEYLHRAHYPREQDRQPDRHTLELGAEVLTGLAPKVTDAHYADPANRTPLALATQCLQVAADYLTALTTQSADLHQTATDGHKRLRLAHEEYTQHQRTT